MKNRAYTIQLIHEHEGLRLFPYRCSSGKWTIGFGRNLEDKGITHQEAFYLLQGDIEECVSDVRKVLTSVVYNDLPFRVQSALIDMRYQLGPGGFRQFKKMISAIMNGDYIKAASEMRNSLWYQETLKRVEELATIVEKH
jgi:lysozyme